MVRSLHLKQRYLNCNVILSYIFIGCQIRMAYKIIVTASKVVLVFFFNWTPCHEGILGKWTIYHWVFCNL